jgi:hypothetical protein
LTPEIPCLHQAGDWVYNLPDVKDDEGDEIEIELIIDKLDKVLKVDSGSITLN